MIRAGGFVRSRDDRDDPGLFYVVLEADVSHVSGPCARIAEPGREETTWRYRLALLLDAADDEIALLVEEARQLGRQPCLPC